MAVEILQASIVVTANFHNPSILHPAFLVAANVVPADWKPVESEVVSTPVASTVKFQNGVVFAVETGKLQITEVVTPERPSLDWNALIVPDLVAKYVKALPSVPYSAVGINPQGFIPRTSVTTLLIEKFLKADALAPIPTPVRGLELRVSYAAADTQTRLTLASGKVTLVGTTAEREGVVAASNYHREARNTDEVLGALQRFKAIGADFIRTTEELLK
jgi:hypothetical protein